MINSPIDPNAIIDAVCERYGITLADIKSSRRGVASQARAVSSHLLYKHTQSSWPEVAMRLGRKSHSTFVGASRRVDPEDAMHGEIMDRAREIMEECNA